jgi:signal peptidase
MKGYVGKTINLLFYTIVFSVAFLLLATRFDLIGGLDFLIVRSGSMQPAIKTGALVVVKPAQVYLPGDVITFRVGEGKTITHRVKEVLIENGKINYITKGDANKGEDPDLVKPEQVQGKVILNIPRAGYMIETVRTPWGFTLIVIIPALLIIIEEMKKIYLELKKKYGKKKINNNLIINLRL